MLSTLQNRLASSWSSPFDAVFREFGRDFNGNGNGFSVPHRRFPDVSLWEDEGQVYVEVDVPGLRQDDLELSVEDGKLWIRGERTMPRHEQKCWYDERRYGQFERAVILSDVVNPNSIDATLADGVLSITLAKKPEHQPHRIKIKYGDSKKKLSEKATK